MRPVWIGRPWCAFLLCVTLRAPLALAADQAAQVAASYPSSFPSPDGLVWDGAFLWATDCASPRIDKVDPATGAVVASIVVAGVNSDELAFDGQDLWISDHTRTEMPDMGGPPPKIYRISRANGAILASFVPPGTNPAGAFPMGLGWDGHSLWNIDTYDKKIYRIDPADGSVLGSIPTPAPGSCGLTYVDGCLWVTSASTNDFVYHLDAATGEVLSKFPGPGGPGHQATGVTWDGTFLWVHDEQVGAPAIYKLTLTDPTEGGRCVPQVALPENEAEVVDAAPDVVEAAREVLPEASIDQANSQPDSGSNEVSRDPEAIGTADVGAEKDAAIQGPAEGDAGGGRGGCTLSHHGRSGAALGVLAGMMVLLETQRRRCGRNRPTGRA